MTGTFHVRTSLNAFSLVDLLFRSECNLVGEVLVFEYCGEEKVSVSSPSLRSSNHRSTAEGQGLTERQLLQSPSMSFWVEKCNDGELDCNPAAVYGQVSPRDCAKSNRIDVVGEKSAEFAECLLNSNTTRTLSIWEELNEICVGKCVVSDIVARGVSKVEE